MSDGWIKLHRKITDWEWYDDPNTFRLFMHLLVTANHKPKKWRGVVIPSGSKLTGLYSLSEQIGLSPQQIRTALKKLKSTNDITIKSTNKYSIISIVKWEKHQIHKQTNNKQVTNQQQTNNKQVTTNKNDNNGNKERKESLEIPRFIDGDTWLDFVKHRGGSKFTKLMAVRIVNQLTEWHGKGHDVNTVLNTSIMNGWKGVFEPDNKGGNKNDNADAELARFLAK